MITATGREEDRGTGYYHRVGSADASDSVRNRRLLIA